MVYFYWCTSTTLTPSPPPFPPSRTCPEIRTLAQALQVEDSDERKTFLRGAFKKLEELDNFVMFMENAMAFMGTEFRFSVRTNMPISKLDRMKSIAGEVAALRRLYLQ